MDDGTLSESPLETVVNTIGEQTVEAFKLLSNDIRLAILLTLWEAKDPGPPPSESTEPAVSFSELRERVGTRDPGQFHYHITKLVDTFVRSTDEGYTLTTRAERILHVVFAGALADYWSFDGEPIDGECKLCGAPTVIDYSDETLIERCTSCEGVYKKPDVPRGMLRRWYLPPVGLEDRTPQEFHRKGNTWNRHRIDSMMEGVCPDCSGSVTTTIHVCEDHDTHSGTVCKRCGSLYEIQSLFVCDVCKFELWVPAWGPIFTEVAVKAFFYEHGLDPDALYDTSSYKVLYDAITWVAVRTEEPLELEVRITLDGDRLNVILDDEARVIDVIEAPT